MSSGWVRVGLGRLRAVQEGDLPSRIPDSARKGTAIGSLNSVAIGVSSALMADGGSARPAFGSLDSLHS